MEEQLYADRAALRCLMQAHPEGTQQEWATQIGRSVSWVKKWVKRLRAARRHEHLAEPVTGAQVAVPRLDGCGRRAHPGDP